MAQQLFSLIQNLSKHEKRYFKLYASQMSGEEGNMYTYLFDVIETVNNEDEELIQNKYAEKFDLKTYISTKFYLKIKLLEAMRLMQEHANPTTEQTINQLLNNAAVFYQKKFPELCEKEILRAEKLAENTENWGLLHRIMEEKLSIYYDLFFNSKGANWENIQQIIAQKNNALAQLKENNDLLNIIYEVKFRLKSWHLTENRTYMQQLLCADILQFPPKGTWSKINFYNTRGLIHKFLTNYDAYCENYQKTFEIWQQNEKIKLSDLKGYLMQSSNYITALIAAAKPEKAKEVLNHLQNETPQLKKYFLNPIDIDPPILHAQKVVYLYTANYKDLINMEQKIVPFLELGNPYFPKTTIIEIRYALGYAFFKEKKYGNALGHLDIVIQDSDLLEHCGAFYVYCFLILYLLCHYELGNYKFLMYEIDRQKKTATRLNAFDNTSKIFFQLIKKMVKYPNASKAALLKYLPIFETYETANPKSTTFLSVVDWIHEKLKQV